MTVDSLSLAELFRITPHDSRVTDIKPLSSPSFLHLMSSTTHSITVATKRMALGSNPSLDTLCPFAVKGEREQSAYWVGGWGSKAG